MSKFKVMLAGAALAGGLAFGEGGSYPDGGFPGGAGFPSDKPDKTSTTETMGATEIQLPPNVTPGWKIRICSEKTKADAIRFTFSPADNAKKKAAAKDETATQPGAAMQIQDYMSWTQGEKTLIEVPSEFRDVQRLRIEAVPTDDDKDKEAQVCILYNDHVAKRMTFDGRQVSTVRSTETGECGC